MANEIVLQSFSGNAITITAVAKSITWAATQSTQQGSAVYSVSGSLGASNALANTPFTVSGCSHSSNNGTFLCLSSTSTSITLNNAFAVSEASPPAAAVANYTTQGFPASYATKIENLWGNQQGDNITVYPQTGDTLVAVAIGLKSLNPFDRLHGTTPAFGLLQGLNDFNANPTISDTSTGGAIAQVTAVNIQSNTYTVTKAIASGSSTIYQGTFTSNLGSIVSGVQQAPFLTTTGASNKFVGLYFTISGFTDVYVGSPAAYASNNGTYLCTASSATQITLANPNGVTETLTSQNYAAATDYVLTVKATNAFSAGQSVTLHGMYEPFLNGVPLTVATGNLSGSQFLANFQYDTDYMNGLTGSSFPTTPGELGAGTIETSGTTVTYETGPAFQAAWVGSYITIGDVSYKIASVQSGTSLTLSTSAGTHASPVSYALSAPYYLGAQAGAVSGNTWTLATNLNIIDSDYTGTFTAPNSLPYPSYTKIGNFYYLNAPQYAYEPNNQWPSAKWNTEGYFPSVYVWVATNVTAGPYTVNLNSMYQNGIDAPQDLAAGKPIFDGGVNFQVIRVSGSSGLDTGATPISIGTTTSNPATAPVSLVTNAVDGNMLLSIGLMKNGNVLAPGTIGGTIDSITLTGVAPLVVTGVGGRTQNFGGGIYNISASSPPTSGAANAFVGYTFTVTGFTASGGANNGTFLCTASTATTITLNNGNAVTETHAGSAAYTVSMTRLTGGKLVGSEAHYVVEYAITSASGTFNPSFQNPLGYEMIVASIALASS